MAAFIGAVASGVAPLSAWADDSAPTKTFEDVSQTLTGEQKLPTSLRDALYAAFKNSDPSFDASIARMGALISANPGAGAAIQSLWTGPNADLADVQKRILAGWYLGIVGSGEKSVCVAYASDLANALVADVLRPQSYAYGAYGSWAKKPI
jgi:hypothetical protein